MYEMKTAPRQSEKLPTEHTHLLQNAKGSNSDRNGQPSNGSASACGYFQILLVYLFTDWPWETVKNIVMITAAESLTKDAESASPDAYVNSHQQVQQQQQQNAKSNKRSCFSAECLAILCEVLWFIYSLLRVIFVLIGMSAQLMTCFRRDRISTDLVVIPNTTTKQLNCNEKREIICGLIIPDFVVFLLAIWVCFGLKIGHWRCCRCFGWKELNAVIKVDTAENLSKLVESVNPKNVKDSKLKRSFIWKYTAIPLLYILLSQGVSVMYLFAFQLAYKDVVIQPPVGGKSLSGHIKIDTIILSFVGFVALDLLYIQVIMRYAYRCQLTIYYLRIIKHDVNMLKEYSNQTSENQERRDPNTVKDAIMKKVDNAYTYIKLLNTSSGTTGFVILIAAFQAANCTFILLSEQITYFEAAAVILRLFLWGFLAIFPFHKAAGLNITSKKLRETGLDMHRAPLVDGDLHNKNLKITLKARVFGIPVHAWLPYLIIILMLLTMMIGSKFKWYDHVL